MTNGRNGGTHLDFGIFASTEYGEEPAYDIYERTLKMAEFADDNGYFGFHVLEHHTTPLTIAPSPSVLLSAVAQRTKRVRIGPLGYLLPFQPPLRHVIEHANFMIQA